MISGDMAVEFSKCIFGTTNKEPCIFIILCRGQKSPRLRKNKWFWLVSCTFKLVKLFFFLFPCYHIIIHQFGQVFLLSRFTAHVNEWWWRRHFRSNSCLVYSVRWAARLSAGQHRSYTFLIWILINNHEVHVGRIFKTCCRHTRVQSICPCASTAPVSVCVIDAPPMAPEPSACQSQVCASALWLRGLDTCLTGGLALPAERRIAGLTWHRRGRGRGELLPTDGGMTALIS